MVKRRIFLLLFLLLSALHIRSQVPVFEKVFGNPLHNCKGTSVKQLGSGSLYFLGSSDSTGNFDLVMTKLTASGQILWSRTYGAALAESDGFLTLTPDDQLLLLGHSMDISSAVMGTLLVKTDTLGNPIWQQEIRDSVFSLSLKYIEPTADSGYIACGYTTQANMGANDFLVMKLDSLGQVEWKREFGYSDNDYAQMIHQTADGGFIVSGDSQQGPLYDNYILKLNDTGAVEWELTVGDQYTNGNQAILVGADGHYYLSGESSTPLGVAFDVYMVKITPAGQLVWAKYVGYTGTDAGFSIVPSADNKFLVTGYSNSYNTSLPINVMLAKIDTSGQPTGVNYYSRPAVSIGYEMIRDQNQNYLIAGFTGNNYYLLNVKDEGYTQPFSNGFGQPLLQDAVFVAYPNPCEGMLTISGIPAAAYTYAVLDAAGRVLLQGQATGTTFTIAADALRPGAYWLQLQQENSTLQVPFIRR